MHCRAAGGAFVLKHYVKVVGDGGIPRRRTCTKRNSKGIDDGGVFGGGKVEECHTTCLVYDGGVVAFAAVPKNDRTDVVGDGGIPGRSVVDKKEAALIIDRSIAGRAGATERHSVSATTLVDVDDGRAGRASATERHSASTLVSDGGRAGVDHDAGAVEREWCARTNEKSVSWRAGIERPSADDRWHGDRQVRDGGCAEERGAGWYCARCPIVGVGEKRREGKGPPRRVLSVGRHCCEQRHRSGRHQISAHIVAPRLETKIAPKRDSGV
jgi:hypothetical protein